MFQALKEFRVGRPQVIAGLMLLAFLAQALWASAGRTLSDLEFGYIATGVQQKAAPERGMESPFTSLVAGAPARLVHTAKAIAPVSIRSSLAIPRPWIFRLPFVIFGVWLGGALWWVARRLFDDHGGYVALALYCTSPAVLMISSNVGPEIILAWSGFGLIYTAIGVAHTLYAPPRKWLPRTVILGLSIGFALATAAWSFALVLLALAFMLYLAPGRRGKVLLVMASASAIGVAIWAFVAWRTGTLGLGSHMLITPHWSLALIRNLGFAFADGYLDPNSYLFVALFIAALTIYGSWPRCRYFGNTAPLVTGFAAVLLFSAVPKLYVWDATLGLSFVFVFIGGIAADLLETESWRAVAGILGAAFLVRAVLGVAALSRWIGWNHI